MFKKTAKRNLRTRKTSDDDVAQDSTNNGSAQIVSIAAMKSEQKKQKKTKKKAESGSTVKQSVLSFGGEDEEEEAVFQLKKSSRSRRIARDIKRLAQEEKERTQNEGYKYTKEAIEELKALSVKRPSFENFPPEETESSSDALNSNNFSTRSGGGGFSELRPGEIPDANRIHAARKQREMMRKYGSEYIPVENASNTNVLSERQDQNDNSSDDDCPTLQMKGIIDDAARVADEIGTEGESALKRDYEFDEWEAEMIKKGISTQQFANRIEQNEVDISLTYKDYAQIPSQNFNGNGLNDRSYQTSRTSVPQTSMMPSEAVKSVKQKISDRLESLEQTHRTRKQDLDRATYDIEESEKSATKMGDLTTISNRYTYFQDVKAYVTDLLDCLSEKSTQISNLENSRSNIWKERADMIVSRRQQDVRDESEDITLSLSNSKIMPTSVDPQKQTRVREREARRTRRRASRQISGKARPHIDGMSTDDEETSMDKAKWSSEQARILNSLEKIFDDVVEEFSNVNVILSKFCDWKEKFPDSYNDAFIGLCLPKLLVPFIKLEVIDWNPLEHDAPALEQMKWYQDLLFHASKPNSDLDRTDSDNKLLAGLFDKVILPKLIFLVGEVWDPLSNEQSHRLCILLCRFIRIYPCMRAENRRCNELLITLCARIQQAIDTDAFIPLYPTSSLSNITSGPGAFFERQTWTCIKLFQNVLLFDGILSRDTLIELSFTLLLNRYIMLSLQISPATTVLVHKCSCIVDAIPTKWLDDVEVLASHLEPFARYLLHVAKLIHNQISQCTPNEERKAKGCIGQLGKLLSRIGSYEMCQEVAEMLGIDL